MKFNKQIAIILVLLSMLLSAIAISLYFYNQNQKTIAENSRLVTIFVASKDIPKGSLITEKDIKESTIARQFVLTKPLLKQEIVNKYAKEPIYVNEAFLIQKLIATIEKEKPETKEFEYNSYNMDYTMFKNPNFTLEPDDVIKIVSVTNENNISVQYVIKNIRVLGFLADGLPSEKAIFKKNVKRVENKQVIEEVVNVRASELILDIKEKDMLSLIEDWNKGNQLWMIKSRLEPEKTVENTKDIKEEIKDEKENITLVKEPAKNKSYIRSYPIKWYKASSNSEKATAIIEYKDNPSMERTKTVEINNGVEKACSKTDKLLIVKNDKAYLREQPSIRAKIVGKVYKNYVIPYSAVSKINDEWYTICDGNYVQIKDTNEISYSEYKRLKDKK